MRAKWTAPNQATVTVPSLQTIVCLSLLALALGLITWVVIAENVTQGRAFPPQAPDGSNAADWVSAVGTLLGAVLTGGALLIAGFSYKHQVEDKSREAQDRRDQESKARRAQAAGVSVLTSPSPTQTNSVVMKAYNGSALPISNVLLTCVDRRGQVMGQEMRQVVAAGDSAELERPAKVVDRVVARFTDAEGRVWRSYVNGELEEV